MTAETPAPSNRRASSVVSSGLTGEGAVEIDDVQVREALGREQARLGGRVVVEDGGLGHLAALEADAAAVLQIDGGVQDHRAGAGAAISSLSLWAHIGRCSLS